jgi:hypothetical protein
MSLADELQKLQELRDDGTLTEEEFAQAKAAQLDTPPTVDIQQSSASVPNASLGNAAQQWVNLQIVGSVVSGIVFLIMVFGIFLPAQQDFNRRWEQGPLGAWK